MVLEWPNGSICQPIVRRDAERLLEKHVSVRHLRDDVLIAHTTLVVHRQAAGRELQLPRVHQFPHTAVHRGLLFPPPSSKEANLRGGEKDGQNKLQAVVRRTARTSYRQG
jgi:hypothetical protein